MSDENKTLVIFGEALAVTPPMGWDVEYETNEDQLLSRRGIICLINVPSLEQDSLLKKYTGRSLDGAGVCMQYKLVH
ncbi:hypothetical protein [Vibrio breoganii]|uniref:hypothetical protein n=1 Tax=Vibrio breoganii TaxID=553239 RepID=UPI001F535D0B|nr:hypothetical protein [Vibrio breoganii]